MSGDFQTRIDGVLDTIAAAARRAGRNPDEITLIAVSKSQSIEAMNGVAEALRERRRPVVFGENYLQEYQEKHSGLRGDFSVHFIGSLQSNKVARAVRQFDLIQSVHNQKTIRLIEKEAASLNLNFPVYLQVNISRDRNKSGFMVEEVARAIDEVISECRSLTVQGLMTITEYYDNPEDARGDFAALREVREDLVSRYKGLPALSGELSLSMGMSADYHIAIEEGATHVRVGTAIFGSRG